MRGVQVDLKVSSLHHKLISQPCSNGSCLIHSFKHVTSLSKEGEKSNAPLTLNARFFSSASRASGWLPFREIPPDIS